MHDSSGGKVFYRVCAIECTSLVTRIANGLDFLDNALIHYAQVIKKSHYAPSLAYNNDVQA
jgi:hypothetical protein